MSRFQKAVDGLFDFVIRVSSENGKKSEAEVAVLPRIAELILSGQGTLIPSPLRAESDESSCCSPHNAVFQLSISAKKFCELKEQEVTP